MLDFSGISRRDVNVDDLDYRDIDIVTLRMTRSEQARFAAMELANARYLRGGQKRRRYEAEKARKRFIAKIVSERHVESLGPSR